MRVGRFLIQLLIAVGSTALLAWVNQRFSSPRPGAGASHGAMSKEEARHILGVDARADAQAIKEAHRRLIQKNHPDQGGSDYLAAKINQARDVLLG